MSENGERGVELACPRLQWFALGHVPGLGAVGIRRLVARFGSPGAILSAGERDLVALGRLTQEQASAVTRLADDLEALQGELDSLAQKGVRVALLGEPGYPEALSCMHDAPPLLHIRGSVEPEDEMAVALVGTRKPTQSGLDAAKETALALAEVGVCVISGMALGIDTAAHTGAIEGNGRTVAVLGSGVLRPYPARNRILADRIAARGAVISEVPATWAPTVGSLMARNRLIAGLARALLVVQSRSGGGATAAARRALALGRPTFALDWQEEPYSEGSRMLGQYGVKIVPSVGAFLAAKPWQCAAGAT